MVKDADYLTCNQRRNKPTIKFDICVVCKKKFRCKEYVIWLERKLEIVPKVQSKSVQRRLAAQLEEPRTPVKVFEWKDDDNNKKKDKG